MNNAAKRGKGVAEELGGKIKGSFGKLLGNERMQVEGKAKELQGKGWQGSAKIAERAKGTAEELAGAIKGRVGAALGRKRMEAAGRAKELQGEARQRANR